MITGTSGLLRQEKHQHAYARAPAAYSPVFTRPPWHNSNFVVVNLINKIKNYAGCPFPFRDEQGPVYLGAAVKHVEKDRGR